MPRICVATTVHPPFDARIFYKEARALAETGYAVTLLAPHTRNETVDRVRIVALRPFKSRLGRILLSPGTVFWKALRERPGVLHVHDPELLLAGVCLGLLTRTKVIYDVHEDYPRLILVKHWLPRFARRLIAGAVGCAERVSAHLLDGIVVVTETIQARFPAKKTVLVRNFPSLDLVEQSSPRESDPSAPRLIYVGGLSRSRGLFEMTEALSLLDRRWNARLMLVGAFEGSVTESELRATRGYDRVDLVGSVSYRRIPSYFRGSSVGLVCLHPGGGHETALPVKLFEYMAAGLPVIASRFPLWERIVRECRCGLSVDPLDPEEISAAIRYLIDHPEEARRMGQNGREAVREKYNWEAEATRLVELYARLLAGEA